MTSAEVWFCISSIFGMRGSIFIQLSFSFSEPNAKFTDLSFVTVIATGDSSFMNFSNSLPSSSCSFSGTGLAFCFTK